MDPDINEILRELDEYVNSQNEDQSVPEKVDSVVRFVTFRMYVAVVWVNIVSNATWSAYKVQHTPCIQEKEDVLVDNAVAEEEMDDVVLTPAVFGRDAVLSEDPSSVMVEPPSASQTLSGLEPTIDEGLRRNAVLPEPRAVMREDETRHTSVKVCNN